MESADILFPEPIHVTLAGRLVTVTPLPIARLVAVSRTIKPALPWLMAGQFQEALEGHFETLRAAVSIATEIPEPDLDRAMGDEFADLLSAILGANLDFFARRLVPALHRLALVVVAKPPATDGSSSPPSSPDGDTTATPSAA